MSSERWRQGVAATVRRREATAKLRARMKVARDIGKARHHLLRLQRETNEVTTPESNGSKVDNTQEARIRRAADYFDRGISNIKNVPGAERVYRAALETRRELLDFELNRKSA